MTLLSPDDQATAFTGVVRSISLRQEIAEALRDDLVTGRLAAGSSLTVADTARRFGVSATPVREALIQLAADGLLDGEHHRGFQVAGLTWTDYVEIVECRRLLAVPLIARVARTVSEDALSVLRRDATHLDNARWVGDQARTARVDRRFFALLGDWCGNRRSAQILRILRVQAWMYLVPFLTGLTTAPTGWRRYRELVDRLADRDTAGAQELMRDYSTNARVLAAQLTG